MVELPENPREMGIEMPAWTEGPPQSMDGWTVLPSGNKEPIRVISEFTVVATERNEQGE